MVKVTIAPATVSLELSPDVAKSLIGIALAVVGDGPALEHMDDIYFALSDAGVADPTNEILFSDCDGNSVSLSGGDEE